MGNYITLVNTIFVVMDLELHLSLIWCADSRLGFIFCRSRQFCEILGFKVLLLNSYSIQCKIVYNRQN